MISKLEHLFLTYNSILEETKKAKLEETFKSLINPLEHQMEINTDSFHANVVNNVNLPNTLNHQTTLKGSFFGSSSNDRDIMINTNTQPLFSIPKHRNTNMIRKVTKVGGGIAKFNNLKNYNNPLAIAQIKESKTMTDYPKSNATITETDENEDPSSIIKLQPIGKSNSNNLTKNKKTLQFKEDTDTKQPITGESSKIGRITEEDINKSSDCEEDDNEKKVNNFNPIKLDNNMNVVEEKLGVEDISSYNETVESMNTQENLENNKSNTKVDMRKNSNLNEKNDGNFMKIVVNTPLHKRKASSRQFDEENVSPIRKPIKNSETKTVNSEFMNKTHDIGATNTRRTIARLTFGNAMFPYRKTTAKDLTDLNSSNNLLSSFVGPQQIESIDEATLREIKQLKSEIEMYKTYINGVNDKLENEVKLKNNYIANLKDFEKRNKLIYKTQIDNIHSCFEIYKEFYQSELNHRKDVIINLHSTLEEVLAK